MSHPALPALPVLLAVATVPPWPISNGYALRVFHLLNELAADWRIVLIAPGVILPASLRNLLADYIPVPFTGPWGSLPSQFDTGPFKQAAEWVLALWKPQSALLWNGVEFLGFERGFPPTVADRIDCCTLAAWRDRHHAVSRREWFSTMSNVRAYATYERRLARALYATVVVGEDDARVLRRLTGRDTIHVIPNGVATPPAVAGGEGTTPTVVFTGVLDYPPNVDAACHFADKIWPGIRAAVPQARFLIAGRRPVPRVLALAGQSGIEVRADVPDIHNVLREAWVAVAPMVCGSGIKNKVLEAWAAGRPTVMTTLATNGLALSPEDLELVADDSAALGALIVGLLKDPERRRRLGSALRERVRRRHRWGNAAASLSTLLRAASGAASRPLPASGTHLAPDAPTPEPPTAWDSPPETPR